MSFHARLAGSLLPHGLPVARDLVRAGLGRVFGPPQLDPHRDLGDPGLFGPGSASWQVVGDPAAIVGGIRALLVQLLHPLAVGGVADHSSFREDPLGRLHRTSAYVTVTTFGSTAEAVRVARHVRGAHRPVTGTTADGRPYRAADPRLLAVVAVALTDSFLAADRAFSTAPVDAPTADTFVAEQARAAALLDPRVDPGALLHDPSTLERFRHGRLRLPMLDEGWLPTDVRQLRRVVRRIRGEHAMTTQTRELLGFLLWPDVAPPIRAGYLPLLAGALATLDPGDLRLLGVPPLPLLGAAARTQTRSTLALLRLAAGRSPAQRAATGRAHRRVDDHEPVTVHELGVPAATGHA